MYLLLLFPLLFRLSGSDPITGPEEVSGMERGSLTVRCRYDPEWETYRKWWCRGAAWGSCRILVQTTESEWEMRKGRVSIVDSQGSHVFTVTMEELRPDDADVYWCGIARTGVDHGVSVKVTIRPATTTASTTTAATTTTITTTVFTAPVTPEGTTGSPTVSSHHSVDSDLMKLSVLLPLVSAVLLLLLVAASVFAWRTAKRQKNAAGISPEQVLQPLESELCYANLTLTQTGASPRSSRRKSSAKLCPSAQEGKTGVEYVTMTSFPKEDISYAALTLDTPNQELIYSNMDGLTNHLYHQSHEEATEYSTIMKP
ncbi:CMRF35-like molecule 1 isoform X2 [Rousettus aegyptiacus]|uniref:CD300 molecule like family member f n=1 Tax=Rousettus aegyptiacus TaxID=9407 RepID=A0A7J8G5B5_ROUAE|nr:CMRF35-like molecule 1 isoform X2 [Rousettus aegyptiacus]KAF6455223.1 CD300 molecule like family member f [Rousettus aegyptiacus]